MTVIGDVSSCHEAKHCKTALHVCDSVQASENFACIGAGTARVGNSETCVLTISILSVQKRGLFHVIAQVLFRQGRDTVVS